jgi:glycosyltransferase involved in cell wall biosynthesis
MRVTYIHQYFTTPEQGGGTRSYEMARRLVAQGHSVQLITTCRGQGLRGWRIRQVKGIEVHELGVPYSNDMGYPRRMAAFIHFALAASLRVARLPADVIFATSTPLTVAIPGIIGSFARRRPMVFEVRDLWPDVPIALGALRSPISKWLARMLERAVYAWAQHIVALAPGMRDEIVAKGVAGSKVSVIPNGCDLDLFKPNPFARAEVQRLLPGLGDGPLVVFTGTIGRANGLNYLVELAATLHHAAPEVQFVIIGDGAERRKIEEQARAAGILDSSMFFTGHVPKAVAARWVGAADMVACLFTGPRIVWKDAVQNKFFDALAAGKPTASNFEGFQSIIARDADIGVILDPSSPCNAARQLLARLRDVAWLAGVPARSAELARGRFSRDRHAAALNDVLQAVAQRSIV